MCGGTHECHERDVPDNCRCRANRIVCLTSAAPDLQARGNAVHAAARVGGSRGRVMGTLENRPARSDELPARPLEILSLDPPADDARLAVRRAMWPPVAVQVCAGLTYAVVLASSWFVLLPGFAGKCSCSSS